MIEVQSGLFEQPMLTRASASLQIDTEHSRAICEEIGYRLGEILRRDVYHELPPRLNFLMQQLAKIDHQAAPSIVPSLDDMIGEHSEDELPAPAMPERQPA
jgi:hypothetical protein